MKNLLATRIAISIAAIFIVIAVSELLLRKINYPDSQEVVPIGWTHLSNNSQASHVNQYDFKGQSIPQAKQDDERWILLIGDSQVESLDLQDSLQMESLLQEKLNVANDSVEYRVFTIGTGGYGQDQQLLWLTKVLEIHDFDMVLLWFTPENDVWNNMFPTHWPWNGTPKPTFIFKDEKIELEIGEEYVVQMDSNVKLLAFLQRLKAYRKLNRLDDFWSQEYLPPKTRITQDTSLSRRVQPWVGESEKLKKEKTHLLLYLDSSTARLKYGMKLTQSLMDSMQQLCLQSNTYFSVFVAENQFYDDLQHGQWMYDKHQKEFLFINKEKYKQRLVQLLEPFSYRILQLQTPDKSISAMDTYHLNDKAQVELSDSLSNWVRELLVIDY